MPIRTYSLNFPWLLCVVTAAILTESTLTRAQPIVEWATVAGTTQIDSLNGMALGPAGELYLAGSFGYTGRPNPTEAVLFKYDSSGQQIAVQAWRGELILDVAVHPEGNYYLTGRVYDPDVLGVGQIHDFYLAKYAADGTLLWEQTAGTLNSSRTVQKDGQPGHKIALDAAGNIYVAGRSTGPAVFGNTTFPATPGGPLLCKFAPTGTLLWAKRAEGEGLVYNGEQLGGGEAYNIALDPDGNILISGQMFNGKADFGGTVVTMAGTYDSDSFMAKYNPAGEVLWVKTHRGGIGVVDRQGNIYSGFSRLDPAGELVWERVIPGANVYNMVLDGNDEPVFAAEFSGTVQLDEHVFQSDYPSPLICKTDAAGKFRWALAGSSAGVSSRALRIVCDRAGTIYVAGDVSCVWVNGVQKCDGISMLGSFPLTLQFGGFNDFFVARLTDPDGVAVELKIARTASGVALSWPVQATNFVLEAATTLPALSWNPVTNNPTVGPTERSVQLPVSGPAKFFRLRQP